MKEFLESFKAKQYGKMSQSPVQGQEAAASSAFQVGDNMPWFLQQAVNNNAQLNGMFTHSDSDSAVSSDDETSYRRRLSIKEDALDAFLEEYGPETAVGAAFWDLEDDDASFEDSLESAVGAPQWEDFDVDDSEDSDESVSDSSEWSDSDSLDLGSDSDEEEVGVEFEEYPLSETDAEE